MLDELKESCESILQTCKTHAENSDMKKLGELFKTMTIPEIDTGKLPSSVSPTYDKYGFVFPSKDNTIDVECTGDLSHLCPLTVMDQVTQTPTVVGTRICTMKLTKTEVREAKSNRLYAYTYELNDDMHSYSDYIISPDTTHSKSLTSGSTSSAAAVVEPKEIDETDSDIDDLL